jgi:hypothetical protein
MCAPALDVDRVSIDMTPDGMDAETRRVRDEVADRLARAGIATTHTDSPDDLARLLEAVEDFERTVELRGGDLMIDEPVREDRALEPDDAKFAMPQRDDGESIDAFIARLVDAGRRAARAPSRSTPGNAPTEWDQI